MNRKNENDCKTSFRFSYKRKKYMLIFLLKTETYFI